MFLNNDLPFLLVPLSLPLGNFRRFPIAFKEFFLLSLFQFLYQHVCRMFATRT